MDHVPHNFRHDLDEDRRTGIWAGPTGYRLEERALLTVMREVFLCHAAPSDRQRHSVLACARRHFGMGGEDICFEILSLVRAMRTRRRSTFDFSNPHCSVCRMQLTYCEHHLMETVRQMRLGNAVASRAHALILCEGNDTDEFLAAARELAFVLAAHVSGSMQSDRQRPPIE